MPASANPFELWLGDAGAGITALLLLATLAMRILRQPILRRFVGTCTLIACALLPLVSALPGLPRMALLPATSAAKFDLGVLPGDPAANPAAPPIATARPARAAPAAPIHWRQIALTAYAAGATFIALRLAWGLWLVRRLVRQSTPPSAPLAALFHRLAGRPIARLRISHHLPRPVVAGVFRPTILVPAALCAPARAAEVEAVLLHELAHARHRDTRILFLAAFLRIGLYVHPLYWLLWRDLRLSQELLADAWAAARIGSAASYAERLVRVAQASLPITARLLPVLQAIRRRSEFYQRMDFLLRAAPVHTRIARRWIIATALSLALITATSSLVTFARPRPAALDAAHDPAARAQRAGINFLLRNQEPSGGWLSQTGPGVTALALRALLQDGHAVDSPAVRRALARIEEMHHADGGYYLNGQPTYNTAIVISTLALLPDPTAQQRVQQARDFLSQIQYSRPAGPFFATSSNSALPTKPPAASPTPAPPPPPAALAIHSPGDRSDDALLSPNASLSYAQFKSLLYARLTPDDPRVAALITQTRGDWSLQSNPLYGTSHGQYYFYYVLAKSLRAYGHESLTDAAGTPHPWRQELTLRLTAAQSPDGSWINDRSDYWLENNPVLVTIYCLLALEETRP